MELIYPWSELKAVKDRISAIAKETDRIVERERGAFGPERERYNALWDERHKPEEQEEKMRRQVIPEVGMPCTVIYYSDRSSAVVTEVRGKKKKEVEVKMCGIYTGTKVFTYRSNGRWVEKGTTSRDWGTLLGMGFQEDYYDESF